MVLDNQRVENEFCDRLVLFGCFPYTTEIRSRACLQRGGHSTTSHLLQGEFDSPAVAFLNLLLPPWKEPQPS